LNQEESRVAPAAADPLIQTSLLGDVLEHAEVATFVLADDGSCVACNLAACRLTGYERAELLVVSPRTAGSRSLYESIVAGKRRRGRTTLNRKDGQKLRIEWRSARTALAGMPFAFVLVWRATD
jgi:PAS domain S-box-containing protein